MDFCPFLKVWLKIWVKILWDKYSQKLLDHAKKSGTDLHFFSKIVVQKIAEAFRDFIGKKIANKITNVSKYSQQNNSETVINDNDKEIPKVMYLQKKHKKSATI